MCYSENAISIFLHQLRHRQPHIQTPDRSFECAPLAVPALPSCLTSASTPSFQHQAPLPSSNLFPKQLLYTYPRSQPPCPAILNYAAAQSSPQVSPSVPKDKFCISFHTWEEESHTTEKKTTRILIVRKLYLIFDKSRTKQGEIFLLLTHT